MQSEPKFICDDHCGRLARWLRFLGFDCAYDRQLDDRTLIRMAIAGNRTILTRDEGIQALAMARTVIIVRSPTPLAQLRQVIDESNLLVERSRVGTRCSVCNGAAVPVELALVEGRVPPYVRRTQDAFHQCADCRRVYWHGTHVMNMIETLRAAGLLPDPDATARG